MFSKFLNLDKEKQDRIINAAMKEYAEKGYEKASTNEMVKEAGISKGLLFHYFGSKKQLFLFLFDYCYELAAEQFFQKINLDEPDFFTRIRQAMQIKMELLSIYPALFKFMEGAYLEDSMEVKPDIEKKVKQMTDDSMGKVYEGIDFSKFRDDMDVQIVLKIITWTFEKMSEAELEKARLSPAHQIDYKQVFLEAEQYFEVLIKAFYK
ncbi:TetR/AcrR family transcriptional regulator [Neobacillus mesonae]|uniref:TetR/AcrR family transcriptional regulator n=1 Tax=Neobacillus mesonae TaxID=1193713 RepID=UPI00203EA960|nr:TetR/AcrR family transcriptional regulator [Neobacillus mesonae]MCM3567098.1 TetR/AcrR family transcriptional regulator [Neobacillus mesonae]